MVISHIIRMVKEVRKMEINDMLKKLGLYKLPFEEDLVIRLNDGSEFQMVEDLYAELEYRINKMGEP